MLRVGKDRQKQKPKKENKENQGQIASDRVKEKTQQKISIYMMHELNEQMMHALMQRKLFNYTLETNNGLEHRVLEQKNPNFEKSNFKK